MVYCSQQILCFIYTRQYKIDQIAKLYRNYIVYNESNTNSGVVHMFDADRQTDADGRTDRQTDRRTEG